MTFIGNDANGTDGSNLALMSALYKLAGQLYRIPADTAPGNVSAALAAQAGTNVSALADMIGTFTVSETAINYFNTLQQSIRDVSNNNSIVIGTAFGPMRTLLQTDNGSGLYQRYLNLLRLSTGISQATFEGSPTTAQQLNSFVVAVSFANTGMLQMALGVLFG